MRDERRYRAANGGTNGDIVQPRGPWHNSIQAADSPARLTICAEETVGPTTRVVWNTSATSRLYRHDHARHDPDTPGNSRRSVYRFVVRSVPDPFMDALDCPDPSLLTPKRNVTTTALQALAMLNDPFVARQADQFAVRLERAEKKLAARVEQAYRLTFGRKPTGDERNAAVDYIEKHGLANFCRVLFNSNEFIFVE